jgi:predicted permease
MRLVLGIQLFNNFRVVEVRAVVVASILRLVVAVGLAAIITSIIGISGLTQKILIVLSGMPSAVFITILATEFDARPDVATSGVILTTVLSLVTLTGLLALLTT